MRTPLIFATLALSLAACSPAVVPPAGTLAYGLSSSVEPHTIKIA